MEAMLTLKSLSSQDFARYGLATLAYLKPMPAAERIFYAVHAADGTFLSQYCDRATACAALRRHDLEAAPVH
jgi:hypothetical protein